MRVVSGKFRGRVLEAPAGAITRPTTDRVREALFSSLFSLRGGFEGAVVLDAFAGSGALGIEAMSRGAKEAVFYECDACAAAVVKRNLATCAIAAPVMQRDVLKAPPTTKNPPFDLVFFDPPYACEPVVAMGLARTLADAGALAAGALVAYEHDVKSSGDVQLAATASGFDVAKAKKYGKVGVTILG